MYARAYRGFESHSLRRRHGQFDRLTYRAAGSVRSDYDRAETIEETAKLLTEPGGTGVAVAVEHLVRGEVKDLAERVRTNHNHIDVLVNGNWVRSSPASPPSGTPGFGSP